VKISRRERPVPSGTGWSPTPPFAHPLVYADAPHRRLGSSRRRPTDVPAQSGRARLAAPPWSWYPAARGSGGPRPVTTPGQAAKRQRANSGPWTSSSAIHRICPKEPGSGLATDQRNSSPRKIRPIAASSSTPALCAGRRPGPAPFRYFGRPADRFCHAVGLPPLVSPEGRTFGGKKSACRCMVLVPGRPAPGRHSRSSSLDDVEAGQVLLRLSTNGPSVNHGITGRVTPRKPNGGHGPRLGQAAENSMVGPRPPSCPSVQGPCHLLGRTAASPGETGLAGWPRRVGRRAWHGQQVNGQSERSLRPGGPSPTLPLRTAIGQIDSKRREPVPPAARHPRPCVRARVRGRSHSGHSQ